jgi:phosphoribosylpyrophosphate synthetase
MPVERSREGRRRLLTVEVGSSEIERFPDAEVYVQLHEPVRDGVCIPASMPPLRDL